MEKKGLSRVIWILIIILIVVDTGYTLMQQVGKELDGDLVPIILYADQYQTLEHNPFGWKAISEGTSYGGVNRFFVHWYISNYFKTVPLLLQHFVSPIDSIYLASGLSKTLIHVLLILVLAMMIAGTNDLRKKKLWYAAAILVPLFQCGGHFYKYFGMVDQSVTYSSFYALPVALLLWFLKPYYHLLSSENWTISLATKIGLFIFVVILPFSGPLVPGIVMVLVAMIGVKCLSDFYRHRSFSLFTKIPFSMIMTFAILALLSLYALNLGRYNSESIVASLTLSERYARLPVGLYYLFTQKIAYPLVFTMLALNVFLVKKYSVNQEQFFKVLKWIGFFTLLYLLLLPLGGFRWYRPNIIRKDTFLPIALCLSYLYAYSTYLLLQNTTFSYWRGYLATILLCSFIFTYADEPDLELYQCQRAALMKISTSPDSEILLDSDCTILSWEPIQEPKGSLMITQMLRYWNIIEEDKAFYQKK